MSVVLTLLRKNILDSRWLLAANSSALFGLCWVFVYVAHRIESALQEATGDRSLRMLRGLGGSSMDFSTAAIEMAFWNHPFVLLIFSIWAIARGSVAVAGEIEKGTMDLVLSRPVSRTAFLTSQVITAVSGFVVMGSAMVAGNLVGSHYNTLISPASASTLAGPALNLVAFGWAIFGYTFFLSTFDIVRWRPNLIASVATLAMFIALVLSAIQQLEMKWLEKFSIFKAYDPVEVVTKGQTLGFNAGILGGIGAIGVVLGYLVFARRDLPAGS
jgi:beta-exotoxin I transport system permease protein